MATLGTGAKHETTEWEDILREKGMIPDKTPEQLAQETLESMVEETVAAYDPHANKTVQDLDEELDDEPDSDEERLLLQYRAHRIAEMKEAAGRPRFGPGVPRISAAEWKDEVTCAKPEEVPVVVHLTSAGVQDAALMAKHIGSLAEKFPHTKFVECKASDAIKNYPDSKVPTLLIYRAGSVVKQFVGLAAFDGRKTTADDVEWGLGRVGAVESEMVEKPQKKFTMKRI